MNTFLAYIWRLIVILIGFAAATLAAALAYILAMQGNMAPDATMTAFERTIDFALAALIVASFGGALIVVPVLILAILAETFSWRGLLLHASFGALLGASVMLLFSRNIESVDMWSITVAATAGIIGASIYWLIAGRNAGKLFERVAAERRALNDQKLS